MKVGILTFCGADNYGSVLQSYALQNFLKNEFRCEVELIDFMTTNQIELYKTSKYTASSLKNIIKSILNVLLYNHFRLDKSKAFDEFRKTRLLLSYCQYNENNYLTVAECYDAIICGSDQIWNMDAYDFHTAYLLKGISAGNILKVSYAPSLGGYDSIRQDRSRKNEFTSTLCDFDAISVREFSGADVLRKLIDKDISILIDPVFLLTRDQWNKITNLTSESNNSNYIFFYSIDYDDSALRMVKKISRKINLPVIVMYTSNKTIRVLRYGFKINSDKSPETFLALVKNAKFVLTTSFHGTAFSIIFQKKFWVVRGIYDGKINNDDRMTTILSKIHLENRNITSETLNDIDLYENINYKDVNDMVNLERSNSKVFLERALFSSDITRRNNNE